MSKLSLGNLKYLGTVAEDEGVIQDKDEIYEMSNERLLWLLNELIDAGKDTISMHEEALVRRPSWWPVESTKDSSINYIEKEQRELKKLEKVKSQLMK